ncbi:FCD domain-containing protein [Acidisoma silvae]|uniref:FCD domain-containing protein n=1 Tax=Acidisoma silvae TaxID=2802396 RepID=A0A964E0Z4_9PROT|nr:FCD domain-containing protein [Acidisoma silvae]MCB8877682.1 FCD domain-containing protein [Acidisoma silvae]
MQRFVDLAAQQNWPEGQRVTEVELAEQVQAPGTPIRAILADHRHLLDRLREKIRTPIVIFNLDARFHEAIASVDRNPIILTVVRQQNALRRLLEVRSYSGQARVRAWEPSSLRKSAKIPPAALRPFR